MAYLEGDRVRSAPKPVNGGVKSGGTRWLIWREHWWPPAIFLLLVATWQVAASLGIIQPLFFPAPTVIADTAWKMSVSGELPMHLGNTLWRMGFGLLFGGVPAIILGLAMGWSRRLRRLVDPFVAAAHSLPKVAILPLMMIFLGVGETPRLVVTMMAAFFPLLINSMAGARLIHPIHYEVASNYGANTRQVFTHVILPGSFPVILSGLRLAVNSTLLVTIAMEMINARVGLGAVIWRAWETMRTEELYTSLFCIMALALSSNYLLRRLARIFAPWQPGYDA